MSNIFILVKWYISLIQNPTIAHILIYLLNKFDLFSGTLKQVPHCPKCLLWTAPATLCKVCLCYTKVTFSPKSGAKSNVSYSTNPRFWNSAVCQPFEQKSPNRPVLQVPQEPRAELTGSTLQLWWAEASAEHRIVFQHLFPLPAELYFYFLHN